MIKIVESKDIIKNSINLIWKTTERSVVTVTFNRQLHLATISLDNRINTTLNLETPRVVLIKEDISSKIINKHAGSIMIEDVQPYYRSKPEANNWNREFAKGERVASHGEAGEQRLKQLVNYDYWNIRQHPKLKTIGYILFMDNESSYKVTFSWSQTELKENDHIFQCGTASCKFVADSGEFSELPAVTQTNQVTPQQALNPLQVHDVDSSKNILNNISSQRSY
ncbi:26620_t:CDS:2, partial [Racocetra persica]